MNPLTTAAPLAGYCRGPVVLPHDADYDSARSGGTSPLIGAQPRS